MEQRSNEQRTTRLGLAFQTFRQLGMKTTCAKRAHEPLGHVSCHVTRSTINRAFPVQSWPAERIPRVGLRPAGDKGLTSLVPSVNIVAPSSSFPFNLNPFDHVRVRFQTRGNRERERERERERCCTFDELQSPRRFIPSLSPSSQLPRIDAIPEGRFLCDLSNS